MSSLSASFWADGRFGQAPSENARVLFGQTRDDVAIERHLVSAHSHVRRALVITSGGCGPMSLLDVVAEEILSVDINPAQNWLTELKLVAWENLTRPEFQALLYTDARPGYPALKAQLSESGRAFWDRVSPPEHGLQDCGLADHNAARLTRLFFATVHSREFVREFLSLDSPTAQAAEYEDHWNSWRWRFALGVAFHPWFLRLVFNREASRFLPPDFPRLMGNKLAHWLTAHPASRNASLWQSFFHELPPDPEGWPLYLTEPYFSSVQPQLRKITLISADVAEVLRAQEPGSLDFISFSNILELTDSSAAENILALAARATSPGAHVLCRSILPPSYRYEPSPWAVPETLLEDIRRRDTGGLSLPTLLLQKR